MKHEKLLIKIERRIIKKMEIINHWKDTNAAHIKTNNDLKNKALEFKQLYESKRKEYLELNEQLDKIFQNRVKNQSIKNRNE